MHTDEAVPSVKASALISDALIEMTAKGLGMTAVLDDDNTIVGIFTDGDLRRVISTEINIHSTKLSDYISRQCKTIAPDLLAAEALEMMQRHKINALLVVNEEQNLVGALNMHDLLKAGMV
jgi:arabinose-5-phosphate isomerase